MRLRFNRRGASTPLWGVEACSPPSRRPNPIPAIPPYVVRTPHLHGHRLRRKHLNSDTNASNKQYLKEIQEKKEETFFFRKNEKRKWKTLKKSKNEEMKKMRKNEKIKMKKKDKKREKKKVGKKGKEGPKGYHPRWAQKLIFHIRTVKRNRNEIEAQKKNQILSTKQRQRK